jgi:hypothetical protein
LKDLSIDLLESISVLLTPSYDSSAGDDDEEDFVPVESLLACVKEYILLIFNFLALIASGDPRSFAEAWMPYAGLVQHLIQFRDKSYRSCRDTRNDLGEVVQGKNKDGFMIDEANRVLEVIYRYHPEIDTFLTEAALKTIQDALYDCYDHPAVWPARLIRSILLNERELLNLRSRCEDFVSMAEDMSHEHPDPKLEVSISMTEDGDVKERAELWEDVDLMEGVGLHFSDGLKGGDDAKGSSESGVISAYDLARVCIFIYI